MAVLVKTRRASLAKVRANSGVASAGLSVYSRLPGRRYTLPYASLPEASILSREAQTQNLATYAVELAWRLVMKPGTSDEDEEALEEALVAALEESIAVTGYAVATGAQAIAAVESFSEDDGFGAELAVTVYRVGLAVQAEE